MLPVHDMLSRSARDFPRREAIAGRGVRMSYQELDGTSTRIARFLRSRGVERGDRVAICSPKRTDEVPVIFAAAKAGCVLVHINPSFRDEQVQHILRETEPAAIFFHESKVSCIELPAAARPPLRICMGPRKRAAALAALSLDALLAEAGRDPAVHLGTCGDDDMAAIIYTSGTTAKAKGIIVTHRIFSDSTVVSAAVLENVATDRLISLTPFSFDGALSQLFTAMLVGGALVLQESPFPVDVVRTLAAERITGCHAVPSFWRLMLARHPAFAEHEFPRLRYLSLIGEVFPAEELGRLKRILGTTDFFMMYGTTEAFRSTCLAPADYDRKPGSVGVPLPGVEIAIVDEGGAPCPAGAVGEIVHRGLFVSPGYWKRDGGAAFRADGVHTGDLGVLDGDGYLYFVGRKDTMIKRLGYRAYPEEIESCLSALPGVAMAAVVCAPEERGDARLRAFIVARLGADLTAEAVAAHCKRRLPHYLQPDEIRLCSALPMTGTWKIDRAGLSTAVTP